MTLDTHTDWLIPQWPAPQAVHALCTTRAGGVSRQPYDSLNLGLHVGDDPLQVQLNRVRLHSALGVPPVWMDQVHGTQMLELPVVAVSGLAPLSPQAPPQADGAFTHSPGLVCTVVVADCLPILLCDTKGTQVAAVHAGWRGLAGIQGSGVVEEIFKRFRPTGLMERAQAAPEIIAWLGPCIGPQAFEVGDEVRAAFVGTAAQAASCFQALGAGKWLADLPALARQRLLAAGVSAVYGNDGTQPWCTVGNPLRFFSHRRDRISGRMAACIWLG